MYPYKYTYFEIKKIFLKNKVAIIWLTYNNNDDDGDNPKSENLVISEARGKLL